MSAIDNGGASREPDPMVPLGPVPTVAQVSLERRSDGAFFVVVRLHTPSGVALHFFDASSARLIGDEMSRLAKAAAAGLHLPGQ